MHLIQFHLGKESQRTEVDAKYGNAFCSDEPRRVQQSAVAAENAHNLDLPDQFFRRSKTGTARALIRRGLVHKYFDTAGLQPGNDVSGNVAHTRILPFENNSDLPYLWVHGVDHSPFAS